MAEILVVDDYVVTQRVLSQQLHKAGHSVVVAGSASEALAQLAQGEFQLAILDLNMPDMDGLTLLQQLRATDSHCHLPIIVLTASGQDQDRIASRAAGANGFMTKPVSSWELVSAVQQLLT